MSFEDVSRALNTLVKGVSEVYRGYYQYMMIEAVFCGMMLGQPTLLIGSHGTFKTSMANFIGSLFDKPVVILSEKFSSRKALEDFFEDVGGKIGVDKNRLMRNLAGGVNVEYEQAGGELMVNVEVDAVRYAGAKKLGDPVRRPLEIFSIQVNDQMDPEDVLGYAIDHPALLGMRPPHAVKRGRLAGADYIVLDEIFNAPRLLSKIHHALNEKVVDTTIGPIEVAPVAWLLATNPLNEFYQTNIKLTNVATLDRYALSARSLPPSIQEILLMVERWKKLRVSKRAPIELIYEARKALDEVAIPDEYIYFSLALVSHLSRCYFSTSRGERCEESKDPFEADKDCSLCIYNEYPCGIANVGKVRTVIMLQQTIRAHALLNMRREANKEDLAFALLTVLPHRLYWNNREFLSQHGSIFTATRALIEKFAEKFASYGHRIGEIEKVIMKQDVARALELKKEYYDAPILRAMLDETIDMMKESAKKRADQQTLTVLEPPLKIDGAIKVIGDKKPAEQTQ